MATLPTVAIPGFAEAIRREQRIRDSAFLDGLEIVCSVEVVPLSLRRLIWLEQARNGFVVPCRFDDDREMLAHALQFIYFCGPRFAPPQSPRFSFWRSFLDGLRHQRFFRRVLRATAPEAVIKELEEWIADAFMDAPAGGGKNEVTPPSYASYPAYIVDKFAEAGLAFTYDEIMDMPLRRLWQHWRVAVRRVDDAALSNPSDALAVDFLAKGNKQ